MKKILCFISLVLIAQANLFSQQQTTDASKELKLKDVSYGSFSSSKMDVYLPANRNPQTPFVIVIHGGAWFVGDKAWETRTQDTLLAHGIASANINYRFANDDSTHYKDLLNDIDSAFRYCILHAKEWHTRNNHFVVNGTSAGAHLSLLYGYTTQKGKIAAIVSECGPTNFTDTSVFNYYNSIPDTSLIHAIYKIAGKTYTPGDPIPAEFIDVSPITHVKNIPTLIFHGTADKTVIFSQATALRDKLKKKGFIYKFIPLPDQDHDLGINTPEGSALIYGEFVKWVLKYGK